MLNRNLTNKELILFLMLTRIKITNLDKYRVNYTHKIVEENMLKSAELIYICIKGKHFKIGKT